VGLSDLYEYSVPLYSQHLTCILRREVPDSKSKSLEVVVGVGVGILERACQCHVFSKTLLLF
jgi:hypothetical protein